MQDLQVSFDDNGKLRIFSAADFEHTQQLQTGSNEFVTSLINF